ncbi:HDOD domain-containing protein [Gynuella sunshinyii]|uniref:Putative signal transduction protein n=1 Tax=Gynuella sunshinyii YC6258 TaxID=1445510 RepID=A0A0C5VQW4_9GAMM|nr:HDOD domain-containing protein [Gynuella sunshinyii]AJQ97012.1 putative signal transduction protein [Gynuella sunshinyii YC6258]
MTYFDHLSNVYRSVIQQVMADPAQLPSLPASTFELRKAVQNPDLGNEALAAICSRDPGFVALLVSAVASPLYNRAHPPSTVSAIVGVLGREKVDRLAMVYSIKSLFVFRSIRMKKVYSQVWERAVLTSGISALLAKKYTRVNVEEVLMAGLLIELGTLAILSALKEVSDFPSTDEFDQLCKEYGKSLAAIMLKKWMLDDQVIHVIKSSGCWFDSLSDQLSIADVVNLGLYCALKRTNSGHQLPPITEVAAYRKLPQAAQVVDRYGILAVVNDHEEEIRSIQKLLAV